MAWPFSVLILTLDEERNLPRCLASVRECDDVVVLDSGSTDRTAAIAREAGARVFARPFDNFAGQRNYAQRELPFRHPWVFHLDADEEMTPDLAAECAGAAERPELDGFLVAPRMLFLGRWIPHCTDYPAWQARFVRAPQFEFIQVGHGQREAPSMRLGRLRASYRHDLSSEGEEGWLEKHRRYARAEAHELVGQADGLAPGQRPGLQLADLFSSDALRRRRALKRAAGGIPFRPAARFFYQYVLRRGFLDGTAGLRYCRLLARYEGFIAEEKRRRQRAQRRGSGGPRIVFVNRFYWPDETATAQLLTDLAEALAARGRTVIVIASRPGRGAALRGELRRGVCLHQVGSTRSRRPGLAGKALDFGTFHLRALARLAAVARRDDIVVALTDPPLLGVGAGLVAWCRRGACVQWVQDIYPEIAVALTGRRELLVLRPLRDLSWRKAAACVTLGREMAAVLAQAGVASERVHVIPNWSPAGLPPPSPEAVAALRASWDAAARFVVAYSGNLGRVHDLEPILAIAAAMRDDPLTLFLFIGDGAQRPALETEAQRLGLPNVRFLPAQPRADLAASLAASDVQLVTLRAGCQRYVFPSKLSGVAAAGRPVLFLGPPGCEPAQLIAQGGFGSAFGRDDIDGAAQWLRELRDRPERRAQFGAAAARFAAAGGGIEQAAERWDRLLAGL